MNIRTNRRMLLAMMTSCLALGAGGSWAYGGGGGGSSGCSEPKFFDVNPTGVVPALKEVSFVASDNTEAPSLTVEIGQTKTQPILNRRGNGDWEAKAALPEALTQAGKVRVAITAKSRDGCSGFQAHFVEIKP